MTIKIFFYCFFTLTISFGFAKTKDRVNNYLDIYPSFDTSLKRYGRASQVYTALFHTEGASQNDYFKFKTQVENLYQLRRQFPNANHKDSIPRIIHQIWLGSPVPERYRKLMSSWQKWKGWTYLLWTDEEVKKLHLHNQKAYDQAENFGERSDILRYELLYLFGGLYVDVDFACLDQKFFNFVHQQYSFYIGIEPLEYVPMSCCNAMMASSPGHPMIKKIIDNLEANFQQHLYAGTVEKSGPRFVMKTIFENFELLQDSGIIFPTTFFYPICAGESKSLQRNKKHFIRPETMAIHFWAGSWRGPEALIKK